MKAKKKTVQISKKVSDIKTFKINSRKKKYTQESYKIKILLH